MKLKLDNETYWLLGGVLALLVIATLLGQWLRFRVKSEGGRRRLRISTPARRRGGSWWSSLRWRWRRAGRHSDFVRPISFLALREFITLTPTRLGSSHPVLGFFIITPAAIRAAIVGLV